MSTISNNFAQRALPQNNNNQPWPPNNNSGNQPAPAPSPAPDPSTLTPADFSFNPQDQFVMPAGVTTVNVNASSNGGLQTDKVKLAGSLAPNADGKYVYDQKDANWTAANTFASVAQTANTFAKYLGQDKINWAFGGPQLAITPDSGEDFNAYYSRNDGGVFFFHGTDPVTNNTIFSGNSGEVTGHETGHALLDSLRPGYFQTWSPDPGAFHESFGDVLALLTGLQNEAVLNKVVEQTGGDLSKQNCAAALGEELGIAINHVVGQDVTGGDFTRNAINDFKWSDPASLPDQGPPNQLTPEVHSWSRLWTGAVYDILKGVTNENLAAGQTPHDAIKNAADDMLHVYANLLKTTAPEGDFTYKDMANAMIASQQQNDGGRHVDLIKQVMTDRAILSDAASLDGEDSAPLPSGSTEISTTLNGPQFGKFNGASVKTLLSGENRSLFQDAEDKNKLQADVARAIKNGQVKWTEPNQTITKKDLFNSAGQPYMGVVRWTDGQPVIERVTIAG